MRKLTITFVVCNPDLSGGIRIIADHARCLKEKGHQVHIVAVDNSRTNPRAMVRSLVKTGRLPASPINTQHFDEAGLDLTLIKRPDGPSTDDFPDADVVIATWWETAEWICNLGPEKGRKVYFIQGYEPLYPGAPDADRVRETYRYPFYQIGVCRWLCEKVEADQSGPGAQGCTLVENGIDLARFRAPERVRGRPPTLGYMYSSAAFKNPDLAVATINRLAAQIADLQFLVFGAQDPLDAHQFPDRTQFIKRPAQSDIPGLYAMCDAWLVTSDHEGFGLPIIEAMACGTPVISTHAGISTEAVTAANGFLCADRTPEALATGVQTVLTKSPTAWEALSRNARTTAERFTWGRASDAFEAALYDAVKDQ
ncbi:MAG: glycosyltransferase family 4 protein [Pseudomonadota bacterium]